MTQVLSITNQKGQIPDATIVPLGSGGIIASADPELFCESFIDPWRFPGHLAPFPPITSLTNTSSVTTALTKVIQFVDETNTYRMFGIGGAKVYEITGNNDTVNTSAPYPHTISGTGVSTSDIIVYTNNGAFEVFVSWNDNTNGNILRISGIPSGDTMDDDYWTAVVGGAALDKDYPHPMAIGDNGILYIADGSVVKYMDLRTGTPAFSDSKIDLPSGWIIQDHIPYKGYHLFAARKVHTTAAISSVDMRMTGESAVFVWDYVKETFDNIYYLEDAGVSRIFEHEGDLWVLSRQQGFVGCLRRFTGSDFVVEWRFQDTSSSPIGLGSVTRRGQEIMWTNGAQICTFKYDEGKKYFNTISDTDTTFLFTAALFDRKFYLNNGTSGMSYVNFNNTSSYIDTTSGSSTWRSRKYDFPSISRIKAFHLYFPVLGGAGTGRTSLNLIAKINGSTSDTTIGEITDAELARGFYRFPYKIEDVYSIGLEISISATVGATTYTFLPSRVDIIYEPTDKGRYTAP